MFVYSFGKSILHLSLYKRIPQAAFISENSPHELKLYKFL